MADFSKSAVMVLKTIKALDGYTLTGLSVTELSRKLETSQVNVTRYLNALVSEGLARKLESGRYALGVGWIQIAQTATSDRSDVPKSAKSVPSSLKPPVL